MKKLFIAFALMLAVTANYAQSAVATTPSRVAPKQSKSEAERKQEVEEFITKLSMSKTQADKMRTIYANFTTEKAALEPLKKSNQADYKVKVKALGEGYVKQVNAILTPTQQKTFASILAERNKR